MIKREFVFIGQFIYTFKMCLGLAGNKSINYIDFHSKSSFWDRNYRCIYFRWNGWNIYWVFRNIGRYMLLVLQVNVIYIYLVIYRCLSMLF